jgi:hypothetical protein
LNNYLRKIVCLNNALPVPIPNQIGRARPCQRGPSRRPSPHCLHTVRIVLCCARRGATASASSARRRSETKPAIGLPADLARRPSDAVLGLDNIAYARSLSGQLAVVW